MGVCDHFTSSVLLGFQHGATWLEQAMRTPAAIETTPLHFERWVPAQGPAWLEQVMRTPAAISAYACSSATSLPYSRRRCRCSSCNFRFQGLETPTSQ